SCENCMFGCFRPSGACLRFVAYPGLTPWANELRPFGARPEDCFGVGVNQLHAVQRSLFAPLLPAHSYSKNQSLQITNYRLQITDYNLQMLQFPNYKIS